MSDQVIEQIRAVLDEHYPEWPEREQDDFEEQVYQSDRAQEVALPAVCAIRAILAAALAPAPAQAQGGPDHE